MLRNLLVICLLSATVLLTHAQSSSLSPADVSVRLLVPNSQLTDILKFYKQLSGRKIWLEVDLPFDRKISVVSAQTISRAEALSLIRKALLQEGIEIREAGDTEAFVSRQHR